MIRRRVTSIAAAVLVCLTGCTREADRAAAVEQRPPEPTAVSFDLEGGTGSYTSGGKTAKFRIDFGAAESVSGKTTGEGTLLPVEGSDSSILLAALQKALRAKAAPSAPATKTSVPFTYVKIGDHLSLVPGGGFSTTPPGDWSGMKLTFGDGARESEMLLHIDAIAKKAQFSLKDARYGDVLLAELAKAL